MGRAPCCEKVGLKRGLWTSEEDEILINFVRQHGHSNWRALPKLAGLLRCGKSCRLRWINYLKPDIKRGSFSKEEEDTIIQLHEMMGNRWSAIASKLPGRTDNEIKNVWHTHLKKRLNKQKQIPKSQSRVFNKQSKGPNNLTSQSNSTNSNSLQRSFSSDDFSSITDVSSVQVPTSIDQQNYESDLLLSDETPIIDDSFWSAPGSSYEELCMDFEFPDSIINDAKISGSNSSVTSENNSSVNQVDFWLNVLVKAGEASELPEFFDFISG